MRGARPRATAPASTPPCSTSGPPTHPASSAPRRPGGGSLGACGPKGTAARRATTAPSTARTPAPASARTAASPRVPRCAAALQPRGGPAPSAARRAGDAARARSFAIDSRLEKRMGLGQAFAVDAPAPIPPVTRRSRRSRHPARGSIAALAGAAVTPVRACVRA